MKRWLLSALALPLLFGCATTLRIPAAEDVHELMIAIRDDDAPAFDAHVDRRALEGQLQAMIVERAARPDAPAAAKALAIMLSGPVSRAAGGLLIQPEVFRAVADYYGYRPGMRIPGVIAIASALRSLPDGRVCATRGRGGPCLITFADEDGTWRMVSFDGDTAMLRLR
ncbi:MAG TPA: hypothetical protein VGN38_13230 [Caulobacteraceae bacterium]|jgi:hypothetical protein|nr:hypothetical protein [Caulobacteraceae bacterium]